VWLRQTWGIEMRENSKETPFPQTSYFCICFLEFLREELSPSLARAELPISAFFYTILYYIEKEDMNSTKTRIAPLNIRSSYQEKVNSKFKEELYQNLSLSCHCSFFLFQLLDRGGSQNRVWYFVKTYFKISYESESKTPCLKQFKNQA